MISLLWEIVDVDVGMCSARKAHGTYIEGTRNICFVGVHQIATWSM